MQSRIEARIDAILAQEIEPGGPGAAVAVLRDGAFIHRKAYGLADLEWETPLSPDAVFRIASVTKQFTAVAVMMLAERGLLDIDAPIETYLLDWPARGRTITVRHLLNHTSGIWRHDSDEGDRTRRPDPPIEVVIQRIYGGAFEFEPGERYSYNNSGYLLLGAIVTAVSGRTWEDFLREQIFAPLGMTCTGVVRHEAVTPRRARGYVRGRKRFHNARLDAMSWSHAAGALGSTLDDLARWDRAIRTERLISKHGLDMMLAPTVLNGGALYPYGFGWGTAVYRRRRLYHHTGGISGYAAQMLHLRDEDLTTIVLSNLYMFPFDKVTRGLLRAALELDEVEPVEAALSAGQLTPCAGRFAGEGYEREVFVVDGGLSFVANGPASLLPLSASRFREADDAEIEYAFSDLRDGHWLRLSQSSPLWPDNVLVRLTPP